MRTCYLGIPLLLLGLAVAACGNDPLPVFDAAPPSEGGMCTGTTPYLGMCTMDDTCVTCKCAVFGHQRVCSMACMGPQDCPAPSSGCMGGFCAP